jgi:hypothetical protein
MREPQLHFPGNSILAWEKRMFQGKGVKRNGVTRRGFLRAGAASATSIGLALTQPNATQAAATTGDVNCILLFLVGGPSHIDTWDPKPQAPEIVRGPFRPIRTSVPGMQISELFPRMAQAAGRFAIVRSVHHEAPAIHESGQQLMQTGRLFQDGEEYPHYGAVVSHVRGSRNGLPAHVVLPGPIGNTGVDVAHGQGAAFLGARHEPFFEKTAMWTSPLRRAFQLGDEKPSLRDCYGRHVFGESCLRARRLVEHGVRFVTVNMFTTVFDEITWDCHAAGGCLDVTLDDYRRIVCPMFDGAFTTLLEDLHERGMLDTTLVAAMGEFGRTPHINPGGGRDHWPGVWSILFAGAGLRGGQVIGGSDKIGAEPHDRPVSPPQVAATIFRAGGIDPATRLPGRENRITPVADEGPIDDLFR